MTSAAYDPFLTTLESAIDRSPLLLPVDLPLKAAIAKLYEAQAPCGLVVTAEQTLVGMLTERDILRLYVENRDLDNLALREVMGQPVVSMQEADLNDEAALTNHLARLQEQPVLHLPLVDDQGRVTGLMSQTSAGCALKCLLTLKQGLKRYQLAEQASGMVTYDYYFAEDQVTWGVNFELLLGYPAALYPQTFDDWQALIHPADFPDFQSSIAASFSQDQSFNLEYRVRHQDGHYLWIKDRNQFIRDANGQAIAVVGTITDITQHKESELKLRASEARFQRLATAIPGVLTEAIATPNKSLVFHYISERIEDIAGIKAQDILEDASRLTNLHHPDDQEAYWAAVEASVQTLQPFHHEFRLLLPSGEIKWIGSYACPVRQENGDITWFGVALDITAQKAMAVELAKNQFRLQEAQRLSKIGHWEWTPQTESLYWSDEIYRLLELDPQGFDLSFDSFLGLLPPEDRQNLLANYQAHVETRQPYEAVYRFPMADGRWKYMCDRVESVFDDNGQPILTRGTCQDVTETYRYHAILQQLVDGTAAVTGDNFFNAFVQNLAQALEVEYAIVAINQGDHLRTLAWVKEGELQPDISYSVAQTPCERVMQQGEYFCDRQVQNQFPDDRDLVEFQAETYLGIAMQGENGDVIGHICVLDTKPWTPDQREDYRKIIRIFAARANIELQRNLANEQLKELNQTLEAKVAKQTRLLAEKAQFQQAILDSTDYYIVTTDINGMITSVNRGAERLYGYVATELIGKTTPLIFCDPDALQHIYRELTQRYGQTMTPSIEAFFDPVRQTGRLDVDLVAMRRDGSRFPLALTITPLKDSHENIIGFLGIGKDITQEKLASKELQESERRYNNLVAASPVGIFQNNAQGFCIYANDRCYKMTGLTPETALGEGWYRTLHPEDLDWVAQAWQQFVAGDRDFNEEYRFILPDGSITWVMAQAVVDRDDDGKVLGYLGTLTDITQRKQAELERQTAIAKLEEAVQQLELAQAEISQNNRLLRAISQAQIAFINATDRLTIFDELLTDLLELTDSEYGFIGEVLFRNDGTATLEESLMKIRGIPYIKTHSVTNIAWDEATQKFYEENHETGMEFTNMNTLFGAVVMTGQAVIANSPRTDPRRGGTPEGHPPLNAFLGLPFFRGNGLVGVVGIANRPGGYTEEIVAFLKPFLTTCSNLIEGYRGDRQRRQAEAQLQLTNQELLRATRLKDEFLANMSHELRTPLNAILGNTEILQEEIYAPITPEQGKALAMVEKSANHLLSLINDVLDVAKIEAGQLELNRSYINIADLCEHSTAFIKHQAIKKQIHIDRQIPSQPLTLWGDERRVSQVLINLLNNAVKFTPTGGQVTLTVDLLSDNNGDRPDRLRFSVTDTGIGIAPEDIAKLFQPFIQIDSALNRQYEGTGLGLTLVKQIVELHGGVVHVTSKLGIGSCFSVDFPYNPDLSEIETFMQDYPPEPLETDPTTPFPLILLAEDNELNASTLKSYLEAKEYRVIVAENGREAIDLAIKEHPKVILMDIQMPEMDGLAAMKQIRSDPNLADIPIIALTALAMDGDKEKCLNAGANAYLDKPVRLKEVIRTIHQLLTPPSP